MKINDNFNNYENKAINVTDLFYFIIIINEY